MKNVKIKVVRPWVHMPLQEHRDTLECPLIGTFWLHMSHLFRLCKALSPYKEIHREAWTFLLQSKTLEGTDWGFAKILL